MNLSFKIFCRATRFPAHFYFLFLILTTLLFPSCSQKKQPYSVIEFRGNVDVYNLSRSLTSQLHKSDSVNPAALLAGIGDIIIYDDNYFCFIDSLESKFQIQIKDDDGYLNGKINVLNISKHRDMISRFRDMRAMDLSALDCIRIDSTIPENYYPYLTELARMRPGIGLLYGGELTDISKLIKIFNPKVILGGSISEKDYSMLSGLTDLEVLMINLNDSVNNAPLPAMPRLNQLIIMDSKSKLPFGATLLSENKLLERLAISGNDEIDLSVLKPLENLKELMVSNCDTISNIEVLKNEKHLELLSVTGKTYRFSQVSDGLPAVRWMTFSSDVTQNEFDSFIEKHPELEVAEIHNNDTIKSYRNLLKLKKLYGLTITATLTDTTSLESMKNLKYLSLPLKAINKGTKRAELQKLLPATKIDANEGFCLGSGWILLIIPFMFFIILFSRIIMRRAHKPQ